MHAILGRKLGMTQIFSESGDVVPVTVLEAGPCPVIQKKTVEKDGYSAVQIGFNAVKDKAKSGKSSGSLNKPERGHLKKHGVDTLVREIQEIKVSDSSAVGDVVRVDAFEVGQLVDVTGTSKGKGFAGVMKRHNFGGAKASHGVSKIHRMPNSSGSVDAARVFKGTKKPGQMGNKKVTTQGLTIAAVDLEKNLLLIRGAVPGAKGCIVLVKKSVKVKG